MQASTLLAAGVDGATNPLLVAPTELITFGIGDEQYGVDIMAVREIRGWTDVRPIPDQPDYVRGVLDLRGSVVTIIDLRTRFRRERTEPTPLHVLIIVQCGERCVGLLADRVLDIVSIEDGALKPVPEIAHSGRCRYLTGLLGTDSGMVAIINLDHLLDTDH